MDLDVWRESMSLVETVYKITEQFPDRQRFGLVSQLRRAAVSVPSNIAEGAFRDADSDFDEALDRLFAKLNNLLRSLRKES